MADSGRLAVGGNPRRFVRLTDAGREVLADWRDGSPVGSHPPHRALARRLLNYGLLTPVSHRVDSTASTTIVVPVRDRPTALARCLAALRHSCRESPLVVVDDGSRDGGAVKSVCAAHEAYVIRRRTGGNPAAARNTGLTEATTPFVAFVDSDVVVPPSWAHELLAQFADPKVGAVAPRVRAILPVRGRIGAYEARHSPLDMGPVSACVGPGLSTPYVPSATLVVRREAAGDGFDEALQIGEDVDLVWRIVDAGWLVRYLPEVEVGHEHRDDLPSFAQRRRTYARSVALLSRRHPTAVPAVRVHPRTLVPWALLASGRRPHAMLAVGVGIARVSWQLRRVSDQPIPLAAWLMAYGLTNAGAALAQAIRRAWAPALLPLAARDRRARAALFAAFVLPLFQDAVATRGSTLRDDIPLRLLDEVVALIGTWEGCLRDRTARPLLPSQTIPARGRL